MRKFRWFSALAVLALAACGDSAGNCSSSFTASCGSGTTASVAKLTLLTDLAQVPSDGSKSATITAQVLDANNNVMTGVVVVFQASSGALIPTQPTTDPAGLALASLGAGSDPSNRTITVTASVGATMATVPVTVNGTTLALSGPTNLVLNSTGNFSVVVTNSANQGIAGVAVTLTSREWQYHHAGGDDYRQQWPPDLHACRDDRWHGYHHGERARADADGIGGRQHAELQHHGASERCPGTLNTPQTVTVTWLNNGVPQVGKLVTFATTRGTLTPGHANDRCERPRQRVDQLARRRACGDRCQRYGRERAAQSRFRRG